MNFKRFLAGVALVATSVCGLQSTVTQSVNTFVPRAFSTDMARELMAEQAAWTPNESDGWMGTLQVVGQYNRNINPGKSTGLGAMPFWNGTNKMTVGLNSNGATTTYDVDAYQFGLGPVTTTGSIQLAPVVYNAGADFLFYVGAHQTEAGFWGKVNAAVGVIAIDPKLTEPTSATAVKYAAGEMNITTAGTTTAQLSTTLYASMTAAFAGTAVAGTPTGSPFTGLQFGKINGKQTSSAKFGDIDVAVGYNFLANDRSHLGVAVRFTGPTGNKPTAVYVLEPVWGNGGHWGLGGEVFGHATLWEGHNDSNFQVWGDIQVQHLFKAAQVRSYDLTANGVGSKYLLVADFGTAGTAYANVVQQLINYSSLATNSTVGAVVDGAVMLQYNSSNWQLAVGYNFAGKTLEKLAITGTLATGRYGVLGQQFVVNTTASSGAALNSIDPKAKMNAAMPSTASGTAVATAASLTNNIQGNADLNVTGAAQAAGYSSKVFGQIAYRWSDSDYCPTLAVQGSGEFSTSDNNALSQWSVGVRGGFSF